MTEMLRPFSSSVDITYDTGNGPVARVELFPTHGNTSITIEHVLVQVYSVDQNRSYMSCSCYVEINRVCAFLVIFPFSKCYKQSSPDAEKKLLS
jgi:hypothetical protein